MIRIATLNLYHFAEAGVGWYDSGHAHDAASWAQKKEWLADTLAEMDAEVVGLQEVVSVAALAEIGRACGYAVCATVAEPEFEQKSDGATTYERPVNAILSRRPARISTVTARKHLPHSLGLKESRHLRRPAVVAELEIPGLGPAAVIALHLKSRGVSAGDVTIAVDEADALADTPENHARGKLEALSRSHAYATIQRVFEATAVYHTAMDLVAADPARPVFVLGDFNDTPESPALGALTPYRPEERDGGAAQAAPIDDAALWRLIDASRLTPRDLDSDARPPTHRRGATGDVIDFVLVSAALHPWNPERVGEIVAHRVHDDWFRSADPKPTSDHAGVSVEIAPLS